MLVFPCLVIVFQLLFEGGINVVPKRFDFGDPVGLILEFSQFFTSEEEVGVLGQFGSGFLGFFGKGHWLVNSKKL